MSHRSTQSDPTASPWREWYRVGLFGLSAYSMAVGWQAQLVSYPLYREVAAADFPGYHHFYNDAIPLVVIVPGFLTFLGSIGYWWTRPADESRPVAGVVAISGVGALLATVAWAIPKHAELDRIGQSLPVIESLLQANLLRSAMLTAGTLALGWTLGRRLTRGLGPGVEGSPDVSVAGSAGRPR